MLTGKKITIGRKKLKMTQVELSKLSGIDQSSLSLYEHNRRQPRAEIIEKLARTLKVTPGYFFVRCYANKQKKQRNKAHDKEKIFTPKGV